MCFFIHSAFYNSYIFRTKTKQFIYACIISSEKKWKIDALKEQVSENNTFPMNFTETWLKKEIQDDKIPGFTTFRSDRNSKKKVKGDGAAIYLKKGYEAELLTSYQIESCEVVAIKIK